MAAPVVAGVIIKLFETAAIRQIVSGLATSFAGSLVANKITAGSDDICDCLAGIDGMLREIDATLKDGLAGRNVDLEGTRRALGRAEIDRLAIRRAIILEEEELRKRRADSKGLAAGRADLINELEGELELLRAQEEAVKLRAETLEAEKTRLEAERAGEQGVVGSIAALNEAITASDLPGRLERLARAVEAAAARIIKAIPAPDGRGAGPGGRASGGAVQPGQPVLVGEQGPEIFVPSTTGTVVNAFDAAADPSAMDTGGAGGAPRQIVRALEDLEASVSELDETIRRAEGAGAVGFAAAGGASRRARVRGRAGSDALSEVEGFLNTIESTTEAIANIDRTMERFRDGAKQNFEEISTAGQEAFQSVLGSVQTLASNLIGGKAGRIVGAIASFARIFNLGFAGGGDLQPGRPALVGERGPEVIVPKVPVSVRNNADTRRLLGGGRPVVVNQTVNMTPDVKNTIRAEVLNAMPIAAHLATEAVTAQLQGRRF